MSHRKKVLIPTTSNSSEADKQFLDAGFELIYGLSKTEADRILSSTNPESDIRAAIERSFDEHLETASAVQALGIGGHIPITSEVMDRAPNLEVIFIGAAGFDKIDVEAASERGIIVVNAPGGNAVGVAEHALGLMLALNHKIATASRIAFQSNAWPSRQNLKASHPPLSVLSGKTLGLVGCGAIGQNVARLAQAFNMNVRVFDPFMSVKNAAVLNLSLVPDLETLLQTSDHVSLHLPYTPETHKYIGSRELQLMQSHACLINTARGEVVDTEALTEFLSQGVIGGAGLDVTDPEPLPDGHPLFTLDNVVLTPHIGGAPPEMLENSAIIAAGLAVQALEGNPSSKIANPDVLKKHSRRKSDGSDLSQVTS